MPSPASQLLALGAAFFHGNQAEDVTFRGGSSLAIVNRRGPASNLQGAIEMQVPNGSVLWLPLSGPVPTTADVILDAAGVQHAVRKVTNIGQFWEATCDVNS